MGAHLAQLGGGELGKARPSPAARRALSTSRSTRSLEPFTAPRVIERAEVRSVRPRPSSCSRSARRSAVCWRPAVMSPAARSSASRRVMRPRVTASSTASCSRWAVSTTPPASRSRREARFARRASSRAAADVGSGAGAGSAAGREGGSTGFFGALGFGGAPASVPAAFLPAAFGLAAELPGAVPAAFGLAAFLPADFGLAAELPGAAFGCAFARPGVACGSAGAGLAFGVADDCLGCGIAPGTYPTRARRYAASPTRPNSAASRRRDFLMAQASSSSWDSVSHGGLRSGSDGPAQ